MAEGIARQDDQRQIPADHVSQEKVGHKRNAWYVVATTALLDDTSRDTHPVTLHEVKMQAQQEKSDHGEDGHM